MLLINVLYQIYNLEYFHKYLWCYSLYIFRFSIYGYFVFRSSLNSEMYNFFSSSSNSASFISCLHLLSCGAVRRPAGGSGGDSALSTAGEEEMPEISGRAPGHQTAPGEPAEPQPRAGEEAEEVSTCWVRPLVLNERIREIYAKFTV